MRHLKDLQSQKIVKGGLGVFLREPGPMLKLVILSEKVGEKLVVEEFLQTLESVLDSTYVLCWPKSHEKIFDYTEVGARLESLA